MKTKVVIAILIIIAIIFIGIFFLPGKKGNYIIGNAQRNDLVEMVSETGSITTNGNINIYSTTNGIVEKIFVKNGDNVSERQKLFTVKSTATPQERTEAFALYQAAKSAVQQAENTRRATLATVNRVHDDVKDHDKDETFLQKESRTTAEVANDNAYDALLAAQANLASAQSKYYSTLSSTVTAPIAGKVSNLSVITGNSVNINSPLTNTAPVLIINTSAPTEIMVTVGESGINKIQIGQQASMKFDSVENKIYQGTVERYDENGTTAQGVAKFNIYLSIKDSDELLKPGMNADVDIITKELKDVLTVPNAAIKPYQKGRAVRVLDKNKNIQYIPVKIGIKGKENTQILDGLSEGQEIIVSLSSEKVSKASLFKL